MVTDPNGKELLIYSGASDTSFSFSASITGTSNFTFDNSFCSCVGGKYVTLDYSVNDKPVQVTLEGGSNGGFPTLIIFILVVVILAIAAVVILMRRPKTNTNNATVSH